MSRNKIFAEKRRAKLEEYTSRFSQDVADFANGLNRDLSRGSSIASSQGSSQITHISESTLYPESLQPKRSRFPPSFTEVKKPKYNFPNWARGLLKTEEENQKLKNHDILLKQIEEDNNYFKVFAQDVHNNIATYPELLAKMIKESTDFLMKNFDKWYDELKMELVNHVKDTLGQQLLCLKQQHLDNTFDTWTRLSEMKANLDEIKTLLDGRESESNNLMTKVGQCNETILKVQQKIEQRLETNLNHEKERHVGNKDVTNNEKVKQKELLYESEDVFRVNVLRSRRKAYRKTIFQHPEPVFTSTPMPKEKEYLDMNIVPFGDEP